MADWKQWLKKGEDWAGRVGDTYRAGNQQTDQLGSELAAKKQMVDEGRKALAPMTEPIALPSTTPAMAEPYGVTAVNPGYQPIGGQNALDQLYAGKPPALLPSPAAKKPLIK